MRVWAPAGVHSSSRWKHHKENHTKKIQTPPAPTHSWGALGQVWFCRPRMLSRTAAGQEAFLWEASGDPTWDGLRRHPLTHTPAKAQGLRPFPRGASGKVDPWPAYRDLQRLGQGKGKESSPLSSLWAGSLGFLQKQSRREGTSSDFLIRKEVKSHLEFPPTLWTNEGTLPGTEESEKRASLRGEIFNPSVSILMINL